MRGQGEMDPGKGLLVVSGLFAWLSGRLPGTIASFLAMSDEVDLSSLFDRLPGWRWVLPRIEQDHTLTFRDAAVPKETHRFGMDQPTDQGAEVPLHEIDILLVPGVVFDSTGARLGRGSGYYDRLLAKRRGDAQAVGVTVHSKVIDSVPVDAHDQSVDWLATESGVRECTPRS